MTFELYLHFWTCLFICEPWCKYWSLYLFLVFTFTIGKMCNTYDVASEANSTSHVTRKSPFFSSFGQKFLVDHPSSGSSISWASSGTGESAAAQPAAVQFSVLSKWPAWPRGTIAWKMNTFLPVVVVLRLLECTYFSKFYKWTVVNNLYSHKFS